MEQITPEELESLAEAAEANGESEYVESLAAAASTIRALEADLAAERAAHAETRKRAVLEGWEPTLGGFEHFEKRVRVATLRRGVWAVLAPCRRDSWKQVAGEYDNWADAIAAAESAAKEGEDADR